MKTMNQDSMSGLTTVNTEIKNNSKRTLKMKYIFSLIAMICVAWSMNAQIIISQYVETSSGTSPKGIELWNTSGADIDFSTTGLEVLKGTNGGVPALDFALSTGILAAGEVLVIGTSAVDLGAATLECGTFHLEGFTFNGDDALVIKLGGITTDVFGDPGSDPGTHWTGGGVDTRNSNISLKAGITTGDTDGWTDPSTRFETTGGGLDLTGFGTPPGGCPVPPGPATLIISQYVEACSGSTPKGIELWNPTASTIDFSVTNLVVLKGTNGGTPSPDFTLTTGTLAAGEVLVVGTADMGAISLECGVHELEGFTFNGDDALVIELGGTVVDVFGTPGTDPGSHWSGSGVETRNSNISLKGGITTGDTDGWSDPSERFVETNTTCDLEGFGTPPGGCPGALFDCPGLSLNIGDTCDDGNAFTSDDEVQSDCTCAGQLVCFEDEGIFTNVIVSGSSASTGAYNAQFDNYQFSGFGGTPPNEYWIVSPLFDFTGTSDLTLCFDLFEDFDSTPLELYWSTSGDAFSLGDWTLLETYNAPDQGATDYTASESVDLASLSADWGAFYIGFRYADDAGFSRWRVSNITLKSSDCGFDCPALGGNIGGTCDDGDSGTFDDVIMAGCVCAGTPFDCPALSLNFGDPCDDGLATTISDTVQPDCSCAGVPPPPGCGDLYISAVIDGPLSGGLPKAIRLTATADIPDLSIFGLGSANNGQGTDGIETPLTGSMLAGESIWITTDAAAFLAYFGFAPDIEDTDTFPNPNAANVNGDDAVELFCMGVVVDVFGDINVDGTGECWEYLDGFAYKNTVGPSGDTGFDCADWTFSGRNALDGLASYCEYQGPGGECDTDPFGLGVCTCEISDLAATVSCAGNDGNINVSFNVANGTGEYEISSGGEILLYIQSNGEVISESIAFSGPIAETKSITVTALGACTSCEASIDVNITCPQVIINEIHYNPALLGAMEQFVELYNPGADPVDITGWTLFDGTFVYPFSTTTILGPGEYLFVAAPGTILSTPHISFGPITPGLPMVLVNTLGIPVDIVAYAVTSPWPETPNGGDCDPTLALLPGSLDNDIPGNWFASLNGGTPGLMNDGPLPVILGCTNPLSCNYNDAATCDDGSCFDPPTGCETCTGEVDGTGTTLANDDDGDTVCNDADVCDGFDDTLLGTPCDDGYVDTVNDTWIDCETCQGTLDVPTGPCDLQITTITTCAPNNPNQWVVKVIDINGGTYGAYDVTINGNTQSFSGGVVTFGPFNHSGIGGAIYLMTAIELGGALGTECVGTKFIEETLCADIDGDGSFDNNATACSCPNGGTILAQATPGSYLSGPVFFKTQYYALCDASGTILEFNQTGLFDTLLDGTYTVHSINYSNTSGYPSDVPYGVGDTILPNGSCGDICGSAQYVINCGCCTADAGDLEGDSNTDLCQGEDYAAVSNSYQASDEVEPVPAEHYVYQYAVYNGEEDLVETNATGDFDFSMLDPDTYSIYGLSYKLDNSSASAADFITTAGDLSTLQASLSSSCADLSDPINVTVHGPVGIAIEGPSSLGACADPVQLNTTCLLALSGGDPNEVIYNDDVGLAFSGFSVPAGTNRVLVVAMAANPAIPDILSVSYNGVSVFNPLVSEPMAPPGLLTGVSLWVIPLGTGPAIPNMPIEVDHLGTFVQSIQAASFQNVDQTLPVVNTASQKLNGVLSSTLTIPSSTLGSYVVDAWTLFATANPFRTANTTWNASSFYAMGVTPTTGSPVPVTWNFSNNTGNVHAAIELRPAISVIGSCPSGTWSGPGMSADGIFDPSLISVLPGATASVDVSFSSDGLYGCSNSETISIDVQGLPSVAISGPDGPLCWENASFQFQGMPLGGTWGINEGFTGNNDGSFDQNVGVGSYIATYTVIDEATGCVNSDSYEFEVVHCCNADAGDLCTVAFEHATLELCEGQEHGGYVVTYDYNNNVEPAFGNYSYAFILADALGNIVQYKIGNGDFDFALLPAGAYFVFGLSYSEDLNAVSLVDYLSNPFITLDVIEFDIGEIGICADLTNQLNTGEFANVIIHATPNVANNAPAMVVEGSGPIQLTGTPAEGDAPVDNAWWSGDNVTSDGLFDPSAIGIYTVNYHYFIPPGCGAVASATIEVVPPPGQPTFDMQSSISDICAGEGVDLIVTMPAYPLDGLLEIDFIEHLVPANTTEFVLTVYPEESMDYELIQIEFSDGQTFEINEFVTVTVDPIAPEVLCKNKQIELADGETEVISVNDITEYYYDNCEIDDIEISQSLFTLDHVGLNTVAVTVTDTRGNNAGCVSVVEVIYIDNILPTLTVNASNVDQSCTVIDTQDWEAYELGQMNATESEAFEMALQDIFESEGLMPTASDNTGGVTLNVLDVEITTSGLSCPAIYQAAITYQAEDAQGNFSTDNVTTTLTVVDNQSPVISGLDASISLSDVNDIPAVSGDEIVSDCSEFTLTLDEVVTGDPQGDHVIERTYTAVDVCNNTTVFVQTIDIDVDELPTLVANSTSEVESCSSVDMTELSAYELGTMTAAEQTAFEEATASMFATLGLTPTATDDDTGVEINVLEYQVSTTVSCPEIASISLTYQAEDVNGNLSTNTITSVLSVQDTEAPIISGLSAYEVYESETEIPEPSGDEIVSDCSSFTLEVNQVLVEENECTRIMDRIYTATDICGNQTDFVQTLEINMDEQAPQIGGISDVEAAFGGQNGDCGTYVELPIPAGIDNCQLDDNSWTHNSDYADANNQNPMDISGTYPVGNTEVSFTVSDMSGNTTVYTITVHVDKIPASENLQAQCDANPSKVAFSWDAVEGTAGYRVQVKHVPGTGTPALNLQATQMDPNFTSKTWNQSLFVPDGKYRFRVYTGCLKSPELNPNQISNYSVSATAWQLFTNPCLAPVEGQGVQQPEQLSAEVEEMAMVIYPNPTDRIATIEVEAVSSTTAIITVRDLMGRTILQHNAVLEKGINLFDMDMSPYANGTYMVEIITDTERKVNRLIKSN